MQTNILELEDKQFYKALGISDNVHVYVTQLNAQSISLED